MRDTKEAVCGESSCVNNANQTRTLCCSRCGKCAEHLHRDCEGTETVYGEKREVPW